MDLGMSGQVGRVIGGVGAYGAFERLFPGVVPQLMLFQVGLRFGGIRTQVATEAARRLRLM